jgi:hypothetical protein
MVVVKSNTIEYDSSQTPDADGWVHNGCDGYGLSLNSSNVTVSNSSGQDIATGGVYETTHKVFPDGSTNGTCAFKFRVESVPIADEYTIQIGFFLKYFVDSSSDLNCSTHNGSEVCTFLMPTVGENV